MLMVGLALIPAYLELLQEQISGWAGNKGAWKGKLPCMKTMKAQAVGLEISARVVAEACGSLASQMFMFSGHRAGRAWGRESDPRE